MTEFVTEPERLTEVVRYGIAELDADPEREGCWTLRLDGVPQSHVDLGDPGRLVADYAIQVAALADAMAPPGDPIRVLHLGGGAMTLARYVAATRPASWQVVVEHDDLLLELVLRKLPLAPRVGVEVIVADARATVEQLPDAAFDLVIADVAGIAQMPSRVANAECAEHVARILRSRGLYAVHVPDLPDLTFARRVGATLRTVFPEVCAVKPPAAAPGGRFTSAVFAAGHGSGEPALGLLAEAVRGHAFEAFLGDLPPLSDTARGSEAAYFG